MKSNKRKKIRNKQRNNRKNKSTLKKQVGRKKTKQLDKTYTKRNPDTSKNVRIQKPKKRQKKRYVISPQSAFAHRSAELSFHNSIVIILLLSSFSYFMFIYSPNDSSVDIQHIIGLHLVFGVAIAYVSMRLREEALVKKYPIICTQCKVKLDLLSKELINNYLVLTYHSVYQCPKCSTEYRCKTRERI